MGDYYELIAGILCAAGFTFYALGDTWSWIGTRPRQAIGAGLFVAGLAIAFAVPVLSG